MKPDHVKKFEESMSYPEYTEKEKKEGERKRHGFYDKKSYVLCSIFTFIIHNRYGNYSFCGDVYIF